MNQGTSGLANWIGQFIANWPVWAVIIVIALIVAGGILWATQLLPSSTTLPSSWRDRWTPGSKRSKTLSTRSRRRN